MRFSLFWIGVFGALAGCGGPRPHQFRVDRTALVPVPVSDQVSGPPEDTTELTLSHATVLWAEAPEKSPASNVGLYVPRHQPGAMVRFRPMKPQSPGRLELDLRAGYEVGARAQAYRVADNGLDASGGGHTFVYWGGYGLSQRFANGFRWSLTADAMIADVSSRIRSTCLDCGSAPYVSEREVREGLFGFRGQLLLGARRGPFEIAAIGALRNHPFNVGTKDEELYPDEQASSRIESGVYFPVAGAVVGFRPHPRATVAASVFWPFDPSNEVVRYGPVAGIAVTIRSPAMKEKSP